jgi:hypothetical protein
MRALARVYRLVAVKDFELVALMAFFSVVEMDYALDGYWGIH